MLGIFDNFLKENANFRHEWGGKGKQSSTTGQGGTHVGCTMGSTWTTTENYQPHHS